MVALIVFLIGAVLTGALVYADDLLLGLVPMVLHTEKFLDTLIGTGGISGIFDIFFALGVSLIVLKFLKKGFERYILWTEGDADTEPLILLTGFFKALAIAVSFPTMYSWLASVVSDLTTQLTTIISGGMQTDFALIVTGITSAGLFTGIISLVFFVCYFMLYIQFLTRGLEILILRVGVPLACVGIMDNDNGVFRSYIQKFFQSTFAVVVQITLAQLGVAFMLNAHIFWGIAALVLALRTPKFIQEFLIISTGQGGGAMNKIYSTARVYQMSKMLFKK
ncbi:MAG: conjugal transfer protein TrbL family protein [Alkaliphilus sp.]